MRYSVMGSSVSQVRVAGGTNIKESSRMGIVFAALKASQVKKLKEDGCLVEPMGEVSATVPPAVTVPPKVAPPTPVEAVPTYSPADLAFAVGLEDFRALFIPPLYGEGVNIAIIDSGIRETHEKLHGLVIYSENFTSDTMRDGFDHGTGVASIITTIAPQCGVLNMKVLNDKGTGTEEEVVLAIDKCIDLHEQGSEFAPSIINLSLGVPDDGNAFSPMRIACRAAISEGIWVVSAAGNAGPDRGTVTSPACEQYVAAVGSVGYEPFDISGFSSRGPTEEGIVKPDAVMFGEDIIVASSASDTRTTAKSGTSFSAAFGTGMVIIYIEGAYKRASTRADFIPGLSPDFFTISQAELIDVYLPQLCVKPEGIASGKDSVYGYGIPYGPLAAKAVGIVPALDTSSMLGAVISIGMIGVMMGMMKNVV